MRKTNEEVKFLTKKQVKKLFDTIESLKSENKYWLRDLAIFNLSYYCGLRISEISLIKWENYNKETGEIYIKRLKGSNNSTIVLDKQRIYILNKYIREYKIKNDEDLLFKTKSWWVLNKSTLEYLVNYYKQKSKLNNFHFHMLKHSIAVHLLELWLSIFELKNYLWHKSINSTMIYSSFSSQMNKEIYNKINKVWLV